MTVRKSSVLLFALLLILLSTISAHAASFFSDLLEDDEAYFHAVMLRHEGVIQGYEDGTFLPEKKINRAEFLKIIISANVEENSVVSAKEACEQSEEQIFADVSPEEWFAPYVCMGYKAGLIKGYPDGTFQAGRYITFAEAAKIVTKGFGYDISENEVWYEGYIEELEHVNVLPQSKHLQPTDEMTRSDMVIMTNGLVMMRQLYKQLEGLELPTEPTFPVMPTTPTVTETKTKEDVIDRTTFEQRDYTKDELRKIAQFHDTGEIELGHVALKWHVEDARALNNPIEYIEMLNKAYDFFRDITGNIPYNGEVVVFKEVCPFTEDVVYSARTITCPNAHVRKRSIVLEVDKDIAIRSDVVEDTVKIWNYGLATYRPLLALSHLFDLDTKELPYGYSRYILGESTATAFAQIKLAFLLEELSYPIVYQEYVLETIDDMRNILSLPKLSEFLSTPQSFDQVSNAEEEIGGENGDTLQGILETGFSQVDPSTLFEVMQLYHRYGKHVRKVSKGDEVELMNQIIFFWSALAKKDLSTHFLNLKVPVNALTKEKIHYYLKLNVQDQTSDKLVQIDREMKPKVPAKVQNAFDTAHLIHKYTAYTYIYPKGGLWVQVVQDGGSEGFLLYNGVQDKVYFAPYWVKDYLEKQSRVDILGEPLGVYKTGKWEYPFANGTVVYIWDKDEGALREE